MKPGDRVAVIDADSILYAISLSAEMCAKGQGMNGEDMWFQVRDLENCYREAVEKFDNVCGKLKADDAVICLSDARCFRYDVLPSYKANRERTRRPPMMVLLRQEIIDRKPFMPLAVKRLEADDVAGITSTTMQRTGRQEPIIVSEDKDMLTIPGLLHRKGHTFEVSMEEADRAHLYQTLIGDYVDGYKGCPGIGAKRAERILDDHQGEPPTVFGMWAGVVKTYVSKSLTEADALVQARTARILRASDWDAEKREPILWNAPTH